MECLFLAKIKSGEPRDRISGEARDEIQGSSFFL
jgi:hypothetical protein